MKETKCEKLRITLVLDRLRSAFNTGNIFRLGDAAGVEEILCCGYTPAPPHSRLEKTALGADKLVKSRVFSRTVDAVRELKQAGYTVVAVEITPESEYVWDHEFRFPLALVLGNEALGVDAEVLAECDGIVSLPMSGGKTSVNVGNCAAAVLYSLIGKYQYGSR
ncbi:MAG: TrmH family RNA methyltransferase [Lentisphaeria bacterium]|nr:TrmH family RNA methyltransferase [Lentisphaeria bacterium]